MRNYQHGILKKLARRTATIKKGDRTSVDNQIHSIGFFNCRFVYLVVGSKILKILLPILAIILLAVSCTTASDKTIQADNKFDTLPLPLTAQHSTSKQKLTGKTQHEMLLTLLLIHGTLTCYLH
jgi:hypothetical protein